MEPTAIPPGVAAPREAEPAARAFGAPPAQSVRFLVLGNIDLHRADHHVTCRVELTRSGRSFFGEARELDTEGGRARAAARATLRAAELASETAHLSLEGAVLLDLFGRRYAAVAVEAASARFYTRLAGLVSADRSVEEAACLATLSAIERWLGV